jgi:hypothetical protein
MVKNGGRTLPQSSRELGVGERLVEAKTQDAHPQGVGQGTGLAKRRWSWGHGVGVVIPWVGAVDGLGHTSSITH